MLMVLLNTLYFLQRNQNGTAARGSQESQGVDDRTAQDGCVAHATLPCGTSKSFGVRQKSSYTIDALRLSPTGQKRLRAFIYGALGACRFRVEAKYQDVHERAGAGQRQGAVLVPAVPP